MVPAIAILNPNLLRASRVTHQVTAHQIIEVGRLSHLVHITNCPAISNSILHWDIAPLEMAPAPRRVIGRPMIIQAAVKRRMIIIPTIVAGNHTLRRIKPATSFVVQVPWKDV